MRSKKSKKNFFHVTYTLVVLVLFSTAVMPLFPAGLVIIDGQTTAIAFLVNVNITLTYKHSVELYLVIEKYVLKRCGLELVELEWSGFGAGMPSSAADLWDSLIEWRPRNRLVVKTNLNLGKVTSMSLKHAVDPEILVDGRKVGVKDNITLKTCLSTSMLSIIVKYIEIYLLR